MTVLQLPSLWMNTLIISKFNRSIYKFIKAICKCNPGCIMFYKYKLIFMHTHSMHLSYFNINYYWINKDICVGGGGFCIYDHVWLNESIFCLSVCLSVWVKGLETFDLFWGQMKIMHNVFWWFWCCLTVKWCHEGLISLFGPSNCWYGISDNWAIGGLMSSRGQVRSKWPQKNGHVTCDWQIMWHNYYSHSQLC